ncbi:MAG: DNA topology modulation protein [Clostridia bacterium]|nr:DNA topology modulation protein [Clostridia bacterium]
MRIAIIGYSGSGKSTLAGRLGEALELPVLHLDTVHWLPGWKTRERGERMAMVSAFLDKNAVKGWIIDGNYTKLFYERRMEESDRIIFLDYPALRCLVRAYKRYFKFKGKTRESMTEGCEEKIDLEFIKWILHDGRTREIKANYERLAKQYPEKFIRCKNDRQLEAIYRNIIGNINF